MEFCILFLQVREKSGNTNYLVHVLFSSSLFIVTLAKCLFCLLSVNVNFVTVHSAIASSCTFPIY